MMRDDCQAAAEAYLEPSSHGQLFRECLNRLPHPTPAATHPPNYHTHYCMSRNLKVPKQQESGMQKIFICHQSGQEFWTLAKSFPSTFLAKLLNFSFQSIFRVYRGYVS